MPPDSGKGLPLVLLPGTLCDQTLWTPMLAADAELAQRARPLALEGRSVAQAVARLAPQLPERFSVAGFSLGAIVALELVQRLPQRVAGFCLIAGNGRAVAPPQIPARRSAPSLARALGLGNYVRTHLWPAYVAPAVQADGAILEHVVGMAERAGVDRFGDQVEIAISRRDSLPALSGLGQPALVVGGMHDAINPPALQQELADGLPVSERVMVPQAGHFVPLEAPAELAAALARWLRRVE